jgi:hypothetical protein
MGEKSKMKIPLGRHRCVWENNIKMDLRGMGCGDRNWLYLTEDRGQTKALVNTTMKLRISSNL